MKTQKWLMAVLTAMAATVHAQWSGLRLNDFAVTNAFGEMVVLSDGEGGIAPELGAGAVFDGDAETFYDAARDQGAWVGFELEEPKIVTRARYTGRAGWTGRINGTLVQGADNGAFEGAVTLGVLGVPGQDQWNGLPWREENLNSLAALTPYKFVRFFCNAGGSYGGNFTGFEFYGCDPSEAPPDAPPDVTFSDCINWRANLRWNRAADVMVYDIQREIGDEPGFSPLAHLFYAGADGRQEWNDGSLLLFRETVYRVRGLNPAGASDWVTLTNSPSNALAGSWFGTPGGYTPGATGDRAFDGNISTFFDAPNLTGGNDVWTGLDFGAPKEVTGLRYLPRYEYPGRMVGGWFEVADNPGFLNATVIHTVGVWPPANSVTEEWLQAPVTARYARYCSPNGSDSSNAGWGNIAEAEFVGAPCAPKTPAGLRAECVSFADTTNAVLAWSLSVGSVVSSSMVYRAANPGGPYACLTPEGVSGRTWLDTGLAVGVTCYYRVSASLDTAGGPLEGDPCAPVPYTPVERLERSWDDLTHIKPGMELIGAGAPYNGNTSVDVHAMFDGNVQSFVDTSDRSAAVGVDLAEARCIHTVRFAARPGFPQRLNGAELRGSNNSLNYLSDYTVLMTFQGATPEVLVTQQTTNNLPFRYIFIQRPDEGEFYGNINELELYGWDPAQVPANPLTAPSGLAAETLPSGHIALEWQAGGGQDFFRAERRPAGAGTAWTPLSPTTQGTSFTDTAAALGQMYEYRVTAVRGSGGGEELAYSEPCFAAAYLAGTGDGLMAYYYTPFYPGYSYDEHLLCSRLEPTPDWTIEPVQAPIHTGFPETAENVRIALYADLHIPISGTYDFHVRSDDGVAVSIGGETVINSWMSRNPTTDNATRTLSAGPHLFRIDYFQGGGGKTLRVEWEGPVVRGVIPTCQFTPRHDLPEGNGVHRNIAGWEGRTFNMTRLGFHKANPAGDAFTLGALGNDMDGGAEGYHFLWQRMHGDFIFEAKVDMDLDPFRPGSKAMLMCRKDLPTGSPFLALACVAQNGDGRLNVKRRLEQNANIGDVFPQWAVPGLGNPCRLRVKRAKGVFTTHYREENETAWVPLHSFEDTGEVFPKDLYIGFAVTGQPGASVRPLQEATFSEVSIKRLNGTVLLIR